MAGRAAGFFTAVALAACAAGKSAQPPATASRGTAAPAAPAGHLCAAGSGPDAAAAERDAMAAVARIFGTQVTSESDDLLAAGSGGPGGEWQRQDVRQRVCLRADAHLEGVQVAGRWRGVDGQEHALACLERTAAAARLRAAAVRAAARVDSLLDPARADPADALAPLRRALAAQQALAVEQAAARQLAVVAGAAPATARDHRAQVEAAWAAARREVRVQLNAEGKGAGAAAAAAAAATAAAEAAAAHGLEVAREKVDGQPPPRLLLALRTTIADDGTLAVGGHALAMARGAIAVELRDGRTGVVLDAFCVSHRAGAMGTAGARVRLGEELVGRLGRELSQRVGAWLSLPGGL